MGYKYPSFARGDSSPEHLHFESIDSEAYENASIVETLNEKPDWQS